MNENIQEPEMKDIIDQQLQRIKAIEQQAQQKCKQENKKQVSFWKRLLCRNK